MSKKRVCIHGDGCLLRLTDDRHDAEYAHNEPSCLPRCLNESCPLYQKAYDFIIKGESVSPDIIEAQRHSATHYHPPVRSQSVRRTRPRAKSHFYTTPTLDRSTTPGRIQETKESSMPIPSPPHTVPKLNLDKISIKRYLKPTDRPQGGGTTDLSSSHPASSKANSEPDRPRKGSITISPKRKSGGSGTSHSSYIENDIEILKRDSSIAFSAIDALSINIKEIQNAVRRIEKMVIALMQRDSEETSSPNIEDTEESYQRLGEESSIDLTYVTSTSEEK